MVHIAIVIRLRGAGGLALAGALLLRRHCCCALHADLIMGLFEEYGRPMEEVTAEFGRPWEGEPDIFDDSETSGRFKIPLWGLAVILEHVEHIHIDQDELHRPQTHTDANSKAKRSLRSLRSLYSLMNF